MPASRPPATEPAAARGDAEVIVVGAGPAGAVTALLLARAGRDVLLLERLAFPRPKPCGDCVSPGAGPLLRRLGLLDRIHATSPARLAGWRLHAPGGAAFEARFAGTATEPYADHALAVPREVLDAAMLQAAVEAGARLRTGIRVGDLLRTDGRVAGVRAVSAAGERVSLRSRIVVGADGLRSIVARRLGLAAPPGPIRKLSLTRHLRGVQDLGELGEMHLAEGACLGLAPVTADGGEQVCNVTLVVDAARYGEAVRRGVVAFQARMLPCFPALSGRLDRATPAGPHAEPLASGPFDRPVRTAAAPGAALVGDAAGYFDPFTGQGIHQAMETAALLADSLLDGLPGTDAGLDSAVLRYARRRARRLLGPRLLQRGIDRIVSRPAAADWWIGRLARAPAAADRLLAATGGLLRPAHLLAPAALHTLLFPNRATEVGT